MKTPTEKKNQIDNGQYLKKYLAVFIQMFIKSSTSH